jgi:hypothetical protein
MQARFSWLRDPSHRSAVVLNKVGLKLVDTSRTTGEYSSGKINDLVSDSKNKILEARVET